MMLRNMLSAGGETQQGRGSGGSSSEGVATANREWEKSLLRRHESKTQGKLVPSECSDV